MNNKLAQEVVEFIKELTLQGDNVELAASLIGAAKKLDDLDEKEIAVFFAHANNFIHSLAFSGDGIELAADIMIKCRAEYERLQK